MHMYFWWDINLKDFLFFGYNVSTIGAFLATCLGFLALAFVFEWLKYLQAKIRYKALLLRQQQLRTICPVESDSLLVNNRDAFASTSTQTPNLVVYTKKDRILQFFGDLGLWLSQQFLGYFLMLSVMVYNGYLVLGILLGAAVGYFVFGPVSMKLKINSCKLIRDTFCMADCGEPDKTALIGPDLTRDSEMSNTDPICHNVTSNTIVSQQSVP